MAKKWFDVTVRESYHHTYRVLAEDDCEADDLVNAMVNNGDVDPTQDGSQSYDRETEVEFADAPEDGDEYWELGDDGAPENWRYQKIKASKGRGKAKGNGKGKVRRV